MLGIFPAVRQLWMVLRLTGSLLRNSFSSMNAADLSPGEVNGTDAIS